MLGVKVWHANRRDAEDAEDAQRAFSAKAPRPLRLRGWMPLLCILLSSCGFKSEKVDLLIHNGTVHTMLPQEPEQQAIAVDSGRIVAVGKEREIMNEYSGDSVVDLRKKHVYPGLIDAHAHFLGYGLAQQRVDLRGCEDQEEMLQRVEAFAEEHPELEWIQGRGWDFGGKAESSFVREKLDELFPDRPILLRRVDGHAAIVNGEAMKRAGIDAVSRIKGGKVGVEDGKATGFLLDAAVERVMKEIPEPGRKAKVKALLDAQEDCLEEGLTTVTDAGLSRKDIELIDSLQKAGELKIRIHAMVRSDSADMVHYLKRGPYRTERLTVNAFKFYLDGALGSRGALLLEPYADISGAEHGIQKHSEAYFRRWAEAIADSPFQMATHCIGDSANRLALDIYGDLLEEDNDRRWRIEHAQVVHPDDLKKFARFNVIPSVQPTHATTDMAWAEERLGNERLQHAYTYRKLKEQNGLIALGTDLPVEDIDPMETFYAAVARKNEEGEPEEGFMPEQALSRKDALRGMTLWAALAAREEKSRGSIEEGKVADLTVVRVDLEEVAMERIREKDQVVATFVGGERLYGDEDL